MSRRKTDSDTKIALPITPMLDMTFQLLFFFIMNFNPADLEGQMDMALPSEASKANPDKPQPKDSKPPDVVPDQFPADLTVVVHTRQGEDTQGGINTIVVRRLNGKEDPVNGLDGLKAYLEANKGTLTNKDSVKILGDSRLRIKHLMHVMDVCKEAGFANTSLNPPEDMRR